MLNGFRLGILSPCQQLCTQHSLVLQVKESAAYEPDHPGTVDQLLAHAEANLVEGNYNEAATLLESGLSGGPQVLLGCQHYLPVVWHLWRSRLLMAKT